MQAPGTQQKTGGERLLLSSSLCSLTVNFKAGYEHRLGGGKISKQPFAFLI